MELIRKKIALDSSFELIERYTNQTTMIREPYRRVVSAYKYECNRLNKQPTRDGFEKFFSTKANINLATKNLAGLKETDICNNCFELAQRNLLDYFHSYVILEEINSLMKSHLYEYNLPNIITQRLNKIDLNCDYFDEYKKEILTLNNDDQKLYEFVKENPKIPYKEFTLDNSINDYTIINQQIDNETKFKGKTDLVNTQYLKNTLKSTSFEEYITAINNA